jgi:hypothetical protein
VYRRVNFLISHKLDSTLGEAHHLGMDDPFLPGNFDMANFT